MWVFLGQYIVKEKGRSWRILNDLCFMQYSVRLKCFPFACSVQKPACSLETQNSMIMVQSFSAAVSEMLKAAAVTFSAAANLYAARNRTDINVANPGRFVLRLGVFEGVCWNFRPPGKIALDNSDQPMWWMVRLWEAAEGLLGWAVLLAHPKEGDPGIQCCILAGKPTGSLSLYISWGSQMSFTDFSRNRDSVWVLRSWKICLLPHTEREQWVCVQARLSASGSFSLDHDDNETDWTNLSGRYVFLQWIAVWV